MDYSKLKGRIVEKFGTQNNFCKEFGCTPQTFSAKLGGRVNFSVGDIMKMISLLDINPLQIGEYFFTEKV